MRPSFSTSSLSPWTMRSPRFTRVSELKAAPTLAHRLERQRVIVASHGAPPCRRGGAWRKGRDSNPRKPASSSGFRDRRNRPLCPPSGIGVPCGSRARIPRRLPHRASSCPALMVKRGGALSRVAETQGGADGGSRTRNAGSTIRCLGRLTTSARSCCLRGRSGARPGVGRSSPALSPDRPQELGVIGGSRTLAAAVTARPLVRERSITIGGPGRHRTYTAPLKRRLLSRLS